MDRGFKTFVVEVQITTPAVKVFRIVIDSFGVGGIRYRRREIVTGPAAVDFLFGKVRSAAFQRLAAENALKVLDVFGSGRHRARRSLYYKASS